MNSPGDIVRQWVRAFNAADAEAISSLYDKHAINHQVVTEPVEGRHAIREMFEREFASAEMNCIVENIFEDGDWAILEWRNILTPLVCEAVDSSISEMEKSSSNVATGTSSHSYGCIICLFPTNLVVILRFAVQISTMKISNTIEINCKPEKVFY